MKKLIFGICLGLTVVTYDHCMSLQPKISIPTTFTLETVVKTALDNVTVNGVTRTATYLASIGLFFLAARSWANSALSTKNPVKIEKPNSLSPSATRYLIGGCVFTTAGLIQSYKDEIARGLTRLIKGRISGT